MPCCSGCGLRWTGCIAPGSAPSAGVAAVGVNALMGAIAHLVLLVIFFTLAGHRLAQAFKLPPASKLLLILAVAAALAGIVLATRLAARHTPMGLLAVPAAARVRVTHACPDPSGRPWLLEVR